MWVASSSRGFIIRCGRDSHQIEQVIYSPREIQKNLYSCFDIEYMGIVYIVWELHASGV